MICDSHAHFEDIIKKGQLDDVIANAKAVEVGRIVAVGGSDSANYAAFIAAKKYPHVVVPTAGFDRDTVRNDLCSDEQIDRLVDKLEMFLKENPEVCALGEIGLDYHYQLKTKEAQKKLFARQLDLAARLSLPVVVHTREAESDTFALLAEHAERWTGDPRRIGVVHCFTGSKEFGKKLLDLGFCLGISGIVTFKKSADIARIAALIPEDRLLAETDTPYLAPEPLRGRTNEPAYVVHVVKRLAEIRSESLDSIARQTFQNAARLFEI